MNQIQRTGLEHVNFTVPDAKKSAQDFIDIFGWHVRWEGPVMNGGHSVHIGDGTSYLALYSPAEITGKASINKARVGHLNHIGIVVDDLDAVEAKVIAKGYRPHSHDDYEPGRRFYFNDDNGLEVEVVSYA
ncbi:MAG: VOC family protein [Pseudomonadota bacterium]